MIKANLQQLKQPIDLAALLVEKTKKNKIKQHTHSGTSNFKHKPILYVLKLILQASYSSDIMLQIHFRKLEIKYFSVHSKQEMEKNPTGNQTQILHYFLKGEIQRLSDFSYFFCNTFNAAKITLMFI